MGKNYSQVEFEQPVVVLYLDLTPLRLRLNAKVGFPWAHVFFHLPFLNIVTAFSVGSPVAPDNEP
jgi:hypothetical protein